MNTETVVLHTSVPKSWCAFVASFAGLARCTWVLFLALSTAPVRLAGLLMGYRPAHLRAASTAAIDIQIHLEDERAAARLRAALRASLQRAARTWAPHPLPLDRIVVSAGVPGDGKADIYDEWIDIAGDAPTERRSLAVISLGLRNADRDLEIYEIAGALSTQIHKLVDERYRRSTNASRSGPRDAGQTPESVPTAPPLASTQTRMRRPATRQARVTTAPAVTATPAESAPGSALADPAADGSTVRAMLDVLKRSQPLDQTNSSAEEASSRSAAA
jgi:hypothetical protein